MNDVFTSLESKQICSLHNINNGETEHTILDSRPETREYLETRMRRQDKETRKGGHTSLTSYSRQQLLQ